MSGPSTAPLRPLSVLRMNGAQGTLCERAFHVRVVGGPDAGLGAELQGTLVVGTHPDASLRLSDDAVSRHHLELRLGPAGVEVVDLGSTNGTFLAGARVERLQVRHETTLVIGRTELRITLDERDLQVPLSDSTQFGQALGASVPMRALFGVLERAATSDATVVLLGETGTGKGLLAEAIHRASPRSGQPFIVLSCGAVQTELVSSELFGHVRGAFTGATSDREGVFALADGGTLLLDEVAELPLDVQPSLLRVLETGRIQRLGEGGTKEVDVRVLAATRRDLEAEVAAGRFREDLYFRLAVVTVQVPPLRERREDIPLLCGVFLRDLGRPDLPLSEALLRRLGEHPWPGNVRELWNVTQRAVTLGRVEAPTAAVPIRANGSQRDLSSLPFKDAKEQLVDAFTHEYLESLMARCGGNVSAAARTAGVARHHLYRLLRRYHLEDG